MDNTKFRNSVYNTRKPIALKFSPRERLFLLLVGDIIAATFALMLALFLWSKLDFWLNQYSFQEFVVTRPKLWFFFLPLIWLIFMVELYDNRRSVRKRDTFQGIAIAAIISFCLYLIVFFLLAKNYPLPRMSVGIYLVNVVLLTLLWRLFYISIFTTPQFMRSVLILGEGEATDALINIVKEMSPPPFQIMGLIDDELYSQGIRFTIVNVLGGSNELMGIIQSDRISDLILALPGSINGSMIKAIVLAKEYGVEVTTMPVVYEDLMGRVPIFHLSADWIVRSFMDQTRMNIFYEVCKRSIDLIGSLFGLVALICAFPLISIAITAESGMPILFKQCRVGKNGLPFTMIKFRTMWPELSQNEGHQSTTKENSRITRVGTLLRKSHLDELPQFINIMRGEMSLVGPRAERSDMISQYEDNIPFYRARVLVKPGLTGWAQINFGYAVSIEDTATKLEYDLYYIKHRSLLMDLLILLRTFGSVIGFKGR